MRETGRYVLSFGCGVNSVALMVHLLREHKHFDEAVFADTGGELPETYAYLRRARRYLRARGKPLRVVRSTTSTLYDTCLRRRVIPSVVWRWSTRDYKVTPIHAYYRSLSTHVYEYMGIAYDEITRMRGSGEPSITTLYPLVEAKLTRADCVRIIEEEGLPLPVKSGCFFCPFNNLDRWRQIYRIHPELFRRATRLEENSKHFPAQSLLDRGIRKRLHVSGLRALQRKFRAEPQTESDEGETPCGGYCMT